MTLPLCGHQAVHSLDVPGHVCLGQAPLASGLIDTAHGQLPQAHQLLDDTEIVQLSVLKDFIDEGWHCSNIFDV